MGERVRQVDPFHNLTLGADYSELVELLKYERPTAIVHFAEQRAAPYSMKSPQEMRYTVRNNLNGTQTCSARLSSRLS